MCTAQWGVLTCQGISDSLLPLWVSRIGPYRHLLHLSVIDRLLDPSWQKIVTVSVFSTKCSQDSPVSLS